MEEEKLLSGYCRSIDAGRRVWVEYTQGEVLSIDCAWGNCPFQKDCEIGKAVESLLTGSAADKVLTAAP